MLRLDMPAEIKADGQTVGEIRGLASTFGNTDSYGDVIEPGAFAKSLARRKADTNASPIAMLDHHRMDSPIGKWTHIEETERGLEVVGKLTMDVQRAKELYALAKDGALGGLSIGFRTVADRIDRQRQVRIIEEIDLLEVSLVSIPANEQAKIEHVRLAPEIATKREFERALVEQLGFSRNAAKSIAARGFMDDDLRDGALSEDDLTDLRDAAAGFKALAEAAARRSSNHP